MNVVKLFFAVLLLISFNATDVKASTGQQIKQELTSYCDSQKPLSTIINQRDKDMYCASQKIVAVYKFTGYALILGFVGLTIWCIVKVKRWFNGKNRIARLARKAKKKALRKI